MKATIDIPDALYRRVKAKTALESHTVREVAISLFRQWTEGSIHVGVPEKSPDKAVSHPSTPPWFGSLGKYATDDQVRQDMDEVRKSIGKGLAREKGW